MGRKSNKKKQARELVKDKQQEEKSLRKKKSEKSKKSRTNKGKTVKKITAGLKRHKKRIFSGAFALIMLAILVAVGYLLLQKAFKAQAIAKFLPADKTIATIEINSNFEHQQLIKTFKLLENHPQYSREKIIELAENKLQINYQNDLQLWLGREVGMALLTSADNEEVNPLYFVEFISRSNLDKFLAGYNPAKNTYNGYTTYLIDGPYYLTFIADYLFVAENEQTLYQLIDAQTSDSLYTSVQYRKINNNLPLNKVAFVYLNFESVSDAAFKHFPILSENGLSMESISPLLKVFKAEGISFIALDDNFAVQSFLSLSDKVAENDDYLSYQSKYNGQLLDYVPADTLFFWGGENLEYQLKRFVTLLSGGDDTAVTILNTVIQSYSNKYFGQDMSFEDDILPLFANEFNFAYEKEDAYKLIVGLGNSQADAVKIHEIAENFARIGAVFEPKVVEHELEDGTVAKEIVAMPKEITKSEKKYGDHTIFELNMGEEGKGLYYGIVDQLAFLTNSEDSLKKSLDLTANNAGSLRNTPVFTSQIEPVMKSSDEVSYLNMPALLSIFFEDKKLPQFLSIFSTLSSGRNYFNDGIVTINYLHID